MLQKEERLKDMLILGRAHRGFAFIRKGRTFKGCIPMPLSMTPRFLEEYVLEDAGE